MLLVKRWGVLCLVCYTVIIYILNRVRFIDVNEILCYKQTSGISYFSVSNIQNVLRWPICFTFYYFHYFNVENF